LPGKHATLETHGSHVFWGYVADKYCVAEGLPKGTMKDPFWVKDAAKADKVAAAILKWATDNGASNYCHWFQPMCAQGRHGMSGQVQLGLFDFDKDNVARWELEGKHLLRGETDGSSFPNGGLRATHTAGGYLTIDPSSQIWLRGDSIFIPACLVSYEVRFNPLPKESEVCYREIKLHRNQMSTYAFETYVVCSSVVVVFPLLLLVVSYDFLLPTRLSFRLFV
jgi:hypothetical protein